MTWLDCKLSKVFNCLGSSENLLRRKLKGPFKTVGRRKSQSWITGVPRSKTIVKNMENSRRKILTSKKKWLLKGKCNKKAKKCGTKIGVVTKKVFVQTN